jgi:hypothetical protein
MRQELHRLLVAFIRQHVVGNLMIKVWGGILMTDEILEKMKKGVYYPGNHLGRKQKLKELVDKGYLHPMDGSFLCGPDSEPNYRLTDKGLLHKGRKVK